MKLAYVLSSEKGAVNGAISEAAAILLERGIKIVGTTQQDTPRPGSRKCDMDVRVLPEGKIIRISQNLGPESRGCQLDPGALEQAVADTLARLPQAQGLILNKFGKHEADGHGFRDVIAQAIEGDIPVIVGTNTLNVDGFLQFTNAQAEALPPVAETLVDWFMARISRDQ